METLDAGYAAARPSLSEEAAARLVQTHWGVDGQARERASERDRVFEISGTSGGSGVRGYLKVSNALEDRVVLEEEAALLAAVSESQACFALPHWRPAAKRDRAKNGEASASAGTSAGAGLVEHAIGGQVHFVRFLEPVPGIPLDDFRPHGPELRRQVGRLAGILDRSSSRLAGADRPMIWDLRRAAALIADNLDAIREPGRREVVARVLERHAAVVRPRAGELRESLIYNDANPANIHVDPGRMKHGAPHVVGMVDFGDTVRSWTVANLAVACAYAAFGTRDPVAAFCDVARGYVAEHEVVEAEADLLYELARLRLALSVTISSVRGAQEPHNEYLLVSQAPPGKCSSGWTLRPRTSGATGCGRPADTHPALRPPASSRHWSAPPRTPRPCSNRTPARRPPSRWT